MHDDDLPVFPNEIFGQVLEHTDAADDGSVRLVSSGFRDLLARTHRKRTQRMTAESVVEAVEERILCPFRDVDDEAKTTKGMNPDFLFPKYKFDLMKRHASSSGSRIYKNHAEWKNGFADAIERLLGSHDMSIVKNGYENIITRAEVETKFSLSRHQLENDPAYRTLFRHDEEYASFLTEFVGALYVHAPLLQIVLYEIHDLLSIAIG